MRWEGEVPTSPFYSTVMKNILEKLLYKTSVLK